MSTNQAHRTSISETMNGNTLDVSNLNGSMTRCQFNRMSRMQGMVDPTGILPDEANKQFFLPRLHDFLGEVSIVGAKYAVLSSAALLRRLLWVFLVLFGIGFMLYQVSDRVTYYVGWPTNVKVRVQYTRQIKFPTVTICNENRMSKSKAEQIFGRCKNEPTY